MAHCQIPAYLTPEQVQKIENLAKANNRSRNAMLREIVARGLVLFEREARAIERLRATATDEEIEGGLEALEAQP